MRCLSLPDLIEILVTVSRNNVDCSLAGTLHLTFHAEAHTIYPNQANSKFA